MNSPKPNILLLFPDQWRADSLSCAGHEVVETPYIDGLAADGTRFGRAYAQAPTCIPARACLATGMSPTSTGRLGYQDGVPWTYDTTLMSTLRDGGYQTMNVGKTHFYPQRARLGFEELVLYEAQLRGKYECDYHRWLEKETGGTVKDVPIDIDPNSVVVRPWVHPEYLHPSCWTAESAIELLRRRDPQRPFFLQVGFQRPHIPIDPPVEYFNMYRNHPIDDPPIGDWTGNWAHPHHHVSDHTGIIGKERYRRVRRGYYAQLTHIDTQIGRILHHLKQSGDLANTLIIFTSDHGEMLGDHNRFSKTIPCEGSASIPFIVKMPDGDDCPRGVVTGELATHIDIMPTLLQAAGLQFPDQVEGCSLLPTLRGQDKQVRDWLHGEHTGKEGWQFVTDGKEKFVWQSASGTEWFFDLEKDPQELHDASTDKEYAERVNLWRRRLVEVLAMRPEDGLSDGKALISGKTLPNCRPRLLAGEQ